MKATQELAVALAQLLQLQYHVDGYMNSTIIVQIMSTYPEH